MLALLLSGSLLRQAGLDSLDLAAQKRDVSAVVARAVPGLQGRFGFLKTNGAYDTGRFGWRAKELVDPVNGGRFVVFTTRITSEDIGEQVFRWDGSKLTEFVPEADGQGVRVLGHELDVRFELSKKRAIVKDQCRFSRVGMSKFFFLRMSDHYIVRSVTQDGKAVLFDQAGGVTILPAPSDEFAYEIAYDGVVDLPGYAGSISANEVLLSNDYWYPMVARNPAPYKITATVPKEWEVVAQGERESETDGDPKVVRYRMDLPTCYFSFSAGKFANQETTIRGRRYRSTSAAMLNPQLGLQNEINASVLDFFSKNYAPYPFTWWGSMDTPAYGGGALEAYSYATYGTGWLPAEDAHEPSHTWFGGMIANTYLKSLWNESFAVFSEGFYAREVPIGNQEERRQAFVSDASPSPAYMVATCAEGHPGIGGAASEIGYGKGGKVLQMLEQELGTPMMLRCIQTWLRDHPKGQAGEWEDFEAVVNRVTKKNYTWFFDQWIRRKGWVDFSLSSVKWQDGQVLSVGKFRSEPYSITCDVMLEYASGKRVFTTTKMGPTPDSEGFFPYIMSAAKPVLVSFDPWRRLLRGQREDERPVEFASIVASMARYSGPGAGSKMARLAGGQVLASLPNDLNKVLLVGDPNQIPRLKGLCAKAGFQVVGTKLTYKGTTIDLRTEGAVAIVDLGGGKACGIAVGNPQLSPNVGRAKEALVDRLGRFLRGHTEPKTAGYLTFRL